jgi:hypothetical protein
MEVIRRRFSFALAAFAVIASLCSLVWFIAVPSPAERFKADLKREITKTQPDTQSILFFRQYGITQFRRSPKASYAIFARVEDQGQPVMHLYDRQSGGVQRLSDAAGLAFDPAVTDSGHQVYALHEDSISLSRLFLDGNEIGSRKGLYKSVIIKDSFVVAHFLEVSVDKNYIYTYDIVDKKEQYIGIDFYVESFAQDGGNRLLMQGVRVQSFGNQVYSYDLVTHQITQISKNAGQCFFRFTYAALVDDLDCFDVEQRSERLRYLAERRLMSWDPALALACSNNYLGRLSWHVAYRIAALAKFPHLFAANYPLSQVLQRATECLLTAGEGRNGVVLGWPTKKYSIKKTQTLSLLVDDAAVLYALLVVARNDLENKGQTDRIIALARALHRRYETDYLPGQGSYRFAKGVHFWADGVKLPFNMQNLYGLALIELYRLTHDDIFGQRVKELSGSFRQSWIKNEKDAALWHYWPEEFYRGWTKDSGISTNTPERAPSEDKLLEDLPHAGINMKFMLEVRKQFGPASLEQAEYVMLKRTLENVRAGEVYSRFISGDTSYTKPSTRFLPSFDGWIELGDDRLRTEISGGLPAWAPPFDDDVLPAYLGTLDQIFPE